ncbi:MAG: disulfide bond formation protein B [Pseudomonadota bacterium]
MLRGHRLAFNLLAAVACFALFGYAMYSQLYQGLQPCPLCIFQRVAVISLGVAFVLAALVPARARIVGCIAAVVVGLVALAGAGVAGRHLYVQSQPPGSVPDCGAPLDYMMDVFPVIDVLRKVLTGSGECSRIDWTFLGLAMPAWVLIWVLGLGITGVLVNWHSRIDRNSWRS